MHTESAPATHSEGNVGGVAGVVSVRVLIVVAVVVGVVTVPVVDVAVAVMDVVVFVRVIVGGISSTFIAMQPYAYMLPYFAEHVPVHPSSANLGFRFGLQFASTEFLAQ